MASFRLQFMACSFMVYIIKISEIQMSDISDIFDKIWANTKATLNTFPSVLKHCSAWIDLN